MNAIQRFWNEHRDAILSATLFVLAFALYLRTLAPSVAFMFDDTLEFQYVIPRLGILHQTGYPFYTLLGKLFTRIVPLNDPAFRLNLLSALNGALAVAMVYFVVRRLVAYRIAAIVGALTFAVGRTFWEQAVAAEVYTLQMLLVATVLYIAIIWRDQVMCGDNAGARRCFYALAFVMGLGLTHHRLILLLYPAITIYLLLVNRSFLRDWKTLARAAVLFALPLSLYLYLPLRGAVGSADGTYQNTVQGFFEWITAQQYTVFLTQNPFQVQRDAAYYWMLFQNQFGIIGLALAAVGIVWLLRRPREWVLLVIALVVEAGFAFNYRTADVEVHFLTTFLLLALFVGAGADGVLTVIGNSGLVTNKPPTTNWRLATVLLLSILFLLIPLQLLITHYPITDLSTKWDVHDYGLDILSQPLEENATVIGIQGEMTLLRYFQETQGIRTDIQTIAADKEGARLTAVENALKQNRVVYLTRPLKGVADKYSLASFAPLIRVQSQPVTNVPTIAYPLDDDFGASVKLLGYDLDAARLNPIPNLWHAENGRYLRVTLYWQPTEKIETDATVSVKVLRKDQRVIGQIDHRPVLDAYPTAAWRAGEVIIDTYDVPIFLGAPPGEYTVNVTLYDAKSNAVIGQRDLTQVALASARAAPRREAWNITHFSDADFGDLALVGYSLDAEVPVRPGDALPLTLLWRAAAGAPVANNLVTRVWLEDAEGKAVASRDAPLGAGFPAALWQPNEFVRDWPVIHVPANVADGKYAVKLAVARGNQLLGATWGPFSATIASLGQIEIKNRQRVMTAPATPHPFEVTFGKRIKLLGYELTTDADQRMARLTLYWKALALMDTSYTVFVHLLDAKNDVVAAGDAAPGGGEFPTTGWIENEYITDVHAFGLPEKLPPGEYPIEIGWYDPITGARLKTAEGQDRVILTAIKIP
jgi:hypothetical protein